MKETKENKIEEKLQIPENFNVELHKEKVIIKGNGKEIEKILSLHNVEIKKEGKEIVVSSKKNTKNERKIVGYVVAHIKKMFQGLDEDYLYKMEICNVHFPMTVKVEGQEIVIKNFLGERLPRIAKLEKNAKVNVKGNIIEVSSHDKDAAGQTVSNIELATKIRKRDRRVFQDGIFLIEKPGRNL